VTTASPRTHYQATFAVLATAVSAYALLRSLVVPVLSTVQVGLHTTQSTVTWVLTAYLLSVDLHADHVHRLVRSFRSFVRGGAGNRTRVLRY